MYGVSVQVSAWSDGVVCAESVQHHRWPDVQVMLGEALAALDFVVPSVIASAKLLVDRVTMSFEFSPSLPRAGLVKAWTAAVLQLGEIVTIKPELTRNTRMEHRADQPLVDELFSRGNNELNDFLSRLGFKPSQEVSHV